MDNKIRIGTRYSQLALWQASVVKQQLEAAGHSAELVLIKSEGDIDLVTPLYAIGVQGVFTRTLDAALLSNRIDLAVHSMKDVPVQMAKGICLGAVLPRATAKDILVYKGDAGFLDNPASIATVATSSLRRKAQWLHRFPQHQIENLRGNINTRLKKVEESDWNGAIFAAAGLDRIGLRPVHSVELDWMVPAPAQGAILVVRRDEDVHLLKACESFHDAGTAACVHIEREFLSTLMGGCSTPVGARATINGWSLHFKGNVCSLDGKTCLTEEITVPLEEAAEIGQKAAEALLARGAGTLIQKLAEK
jgi:hydroxymethylbilane synthase